MKVSAFAFSTFLTLSSAVISNAYGQDQCTGNACDKYMRTGTAFDIAQQYSKGGKFGGATSATTGTMFDVARASVDPFGGPELFASAWRVPPAVAKGD
jgi:hypothetical protein